MLTAKRGTCDGGLSRPVSRRPSHTKWRTVPRRRLSWGFSFSPDSSTRRPTNLATSRDSAASSSSTERMSSREWAYSDGGTPSGHRPRVSSAAAALPYARSSRTRPACASGAPRRGPSGGAASTAPAADGASGGARAREEEAHDLRRLGVRRAARADERERAARRRLAGRRPRRQQLGHEGARVARRPHGEQRRRAVRRARRRRRRRRAQQQPRARDVAVARRVVQRARAPAAPRRRAPPRARAAAARSPRCPRRTPRAAPSRRPRSPCRPRPGT